MNALIQKEPVTSGLAGSVKHRKPLAIQPKLMVNTPGDIYEQEADAMADRVMRMPGNDAEKQPLTGLIGRSVYRKCASCEEDENKLLQKKEVTGSGSGVAQIDAPSIVHEALSFPGQPLDAKTRAFMEPRFGYDFSGVRVHTDAKAAESAQAIHARAFTVGRDVVFGAGQYAPGKDPGRNLLAHELTHVIQQPHHTPMIQRGIIKGTTPAAVPAGSVIHRGSLGEAQWLQGHRNSGNAFSEAVSYVFVGSSLSSQTTNAIAVNCNQRGGFQDKLLCLHDGVHAAVQTLEASDGNPHDQDYVCRNYAASVHDVSQHMGLSPDWETSTTHAWVEFTGNNRQYVIDAYNEILFSYPV